MKAVFPGAASCQACSEQMSICSFMITVDGNSDGTDFSRFHVRNLAVDIQGVRIGWAA